MSPTQNATSPLQCPDGCCCHGGGWLDPAACAGCAMPQGQGAADVLAPSGHAPALCPTAPVGQSCGLPSTHRCCHMPPSICWAMGHHQGALLLLSNRQSHWLRAGRRQGAACTLTARGGPSLPPLALAGHPLPTVTVACGKTSVAMWLLSRGLGEGIFGMLGVGTGWG